MRNPFAAAIDALGAFFELKATELRHSVSLVEAVAASEFEIELLALTGFSGRDDARRVAIDAAKLGLRTVDLQPMARIYFRSRAVGVGPDDLLELAHRPEQLRRIAAAVVEAYTPDGVVTWWTAWVTADENRRDLMEGGVLAAWSGIFPDARAHGE